MSSLISRIVVSLIGLPLVLGLLWVGGWPLFGLAVFAAVVAVHEFVTMARPLRPLAPATYVGVVLALVGAHTAGVPWMQFRFQIRQQIGGRRADTARRRVAVEVEWRDRAVPPVSLEKAREPIVLALPSPELPVPRRTEIDPCFRSMAAQAHPHRLPYLKERGRSTAHRGRIR